MSILIRKRFQRLADEMDTLKGRVRVALATEISGAIASAVRDVVQAVVAGAVESVRQPQHVRYVHGWDDDRDDEPYEELRSDGVAGITPIAAVAAGVQVARWWLLRKGTVCGAAGAGVVVGCAGFFGGPVTRAALAALGVTADLLAFTDALDGTTSHMTDD